MEEKNEVNFYFKDVDKNRHKMTVSYQEVIDLMSKLKTDKNKWYVIYPGTHQQYSVTEIFNILAKMKEGYVGRFPSTYGVLKLENLGFVCVYNPNVDSILIDNKDNKDIPYPLTVSRQDVVDAMKDIEPEISNVGDQHYHGKYILHPDSKKRYGVTKVFMRIVKNKTGIDITRFPAGKGRMNLIKLGFESGNDKKVLGKKINPKVKS